MKVPAVPKIAEPPYIKVEPEPMVQVQLQDDTPFIVLVVVIDAFVSTVISIPEFNTRAPKVMVPLSCWSTVKVLVPVRETAPLLVCVIPPAVCMVVLPPLSVPELTVMRPVKSLVVVLPETVRVPPETVVVPFTVRVPVVFDTVKLPALTTRLLML